MFRRLTMRYVREHPLASALIAAAVVVYLVFR
jgi:hypothetical protein